MIKSKGALEDGTLYWVEQRLNDWTFHLTRDTEEARVRVPVVKLAALDFKLTPAAVESFILPIATWHQRDTQPGRIR